MLPISVACLTLHLDSFWSELFQLLYTSQKFYLYDNPGVKKNIKITSGLNKKTLELEGSC